MRFPCKVKNNSGPQIVTWADGTDEEIMAMLDAHYNGDIDIHDYWTVGDKRIVTLSAMSEVESHAQQNVTYVLSHAGGKYLSDGVTECAFQVDQVDCLNEKGHVNSSGNNTGGWTHSDRRTWCNSTYKNAIPSTLRSVFKEFINQSGLGGSSTSGVENTTDTFALRAEIELFGVNSTTGGSNYYSVAGEGSQVKWYETSSNRAKQIDGRYLPWWQRSPSSGYPYFGRCNYAGDPGLGVPSEKWGIPPFGCI